MGFRSPKWQLGTDRQDLSDTGEFLVGTADTRHRNRKQQNTKEKNQTTKPTYGILGTVPESQRPFPEDRALHTAGPFTAAKL